MFVNRSGSGDLARDQDYNRTYSVDGRLGIGQAGTISGFLAGTDTPGVSGDTHAYDLNGRYESERYRVTLGYTEVAPDFNPEVGFYARRGYRRVNPSVFTTFRPRDTWGLQELRPHVAHFTIWNYDTGQHETQFTHIDNHFEWKNGHPRFTRA